MRVFLRLCKIQDGPFLDSPSLFGIMCLSFSYVCTNKQKEKGFTFPPCVISLRPFGALCYGIGYVVLLDSFPYETGLTHLMFVLVFCPDRMG